MKRITSEEYERRLASYHQGGTRKEMAERCGVNYYAYKDWLFRNGLVKQFFKKYSYDINDTPLEQRLNVEDFIISLIKIDEKYGPLNKDQISDAMEEWRPSREGSTRARRRGRHTDEHK